MPVSTVSLSTGVAAGPGAHCSWRALLRAALDAAHATPGRQRHLRGPGPVSHVRNHAHPRVQAASRVREEGAPAAPHGPLRCALAAGPAGGGVGEAARLRPARRPGRRVGVSAPRRLRAGPLRLSLSSVARLRRRSPLAEGRAEKGSLSSCRQEEEAAPRGAGRPPSLAVRPRHARHVENAPGREGAEKEYSVEAADTVCQAAADFC